jgi:hypothetical protein
MQQIGQRHRRFAESHSGAPHEHGVYRQDFPFPHCAHDPPAAVFADLLNALGSRENEIGISARDIFE